MMTRNARKLVLVILMTMAPMALTGCALLEALLGGESGGTGGGPVAAAPRSGGGLSPRSGGGFAPQGGFSPGGFGPNAGVEPGGEIIPGVRALPPVETPREAPAAPQVDGRVVKDFPRQSPAATPDGLARGKGDIEVA